MFVCVVDDGQGLQIGYSTTATLSMKIAVAPTVLILYQILLDAF